MAAYAALASVMNIIHDIQQHHSPPISFETQQLQSLTRILTTLLQFLEAYKSPVADGDEADPLEMRIADAAYAVEDVIESHIVDTIQQTSFPTPKNFYQDLQQVIDEMELINKEAMKIDTEKAGVILNHGVSASAAPLRSSSPSSAMVCPEAVLLGLLEKLTGGRLERQVIPIVGMGGIGKTTLARNIYAHQLIKEYFHVCAWVTISQQYNTRELLCEALSQATKKKKEELSERSEGELGSELYKYLFGRRFLIVMDDMWSIDAWVKIQRFFPNNLEGSRILVTTRLSQLSSQLNTNYSLQMEFLDEVGSWDLFTKTVFGERSCPPELMNIGKKIVRNCRGLPLSIVVVGGILKKTEHTEACWESIRNNLTSVVNLENDKHCLRLLKLSYNHLPVYLKPCFLFMGVFEEDDQIRVSMIIKLWVSEGFLKPMNGRSSETIAMGFLKDLVDRNLIMIDQLGSTGNIKWCIIHDLLRDLCLNEVQKDGFYHVIGRSKGIDNRQYRRIVIPGKTSKEKVLEGLPSMSRPRSIICEKGEVPPCPNFGLLRTFHAYKRRTSPYQRYMNSLAFQSVNLRHLAVEVDRMSSFFSSGNLFWSLHTLIVSCSNYNDEPTATAEIWKMRQLRHIEFTGSPLCLPDPPSNMDEDGVAMENLRILKGIKNLKCSEKVVKRIPNIKKLKLKYGGQLKDSMSDDYYCVGNIKNLSKLEFLVVSCDSKLTPYLHKLSFPHSLKKLTLWMGTYEFEWEEMVEKIGSLPCLEKLRLWMGCFGTGKWEIVEGQFPELKYLELFRCKGLKQWTVEGSSVLPRLEHLHLGIIKELEEIPREIGYIPTLQEIRMARCSESAVRSAKELVEEQVECQGEPLPFHVQVFLMGRNQALRSLAAPPSFTIDG